MAGTKKAGKGSPKLKRSGRHKTKYQLQFRRTFNNKLKRVRKHNGEKSAREYVLKYGPYSKGE